MYKNLYTTKIMKKTQKTSKRDVDIAIGRYKAVVAERENKGLRK
jgi:phage-related protein